MRTQSGFVDLPHFGCFRAYDGSATAQNHALRGTRDNRSPENLSRNWAIKDQNTPNRTTFKNMSSQAPREVKGYVIPTDIKPEIHGVDSSHLTKAAATKWSSLPDEKDLNIPKLLDLTEDNLTENVIRINSQGKENPRLNYVLSKLVKVLHDFVKDVELQTEEWELAWQFLTKTGQISDDTRHEFILLSDILGISALVDTITYPRVEGATESSVLGPFFDDAAHELECGDSICSEDRGEVTLVRGKVLDATTGKPISKAMIEYKSSEKMGIDL